MLHVKILVLSTVLIVLSACNSQHEDETASDVIPATTTIDSTLSAEATDESTDRRMSDSTLVLSLELYPFVPDSIFGYDDGIDQDSVIIKWQISNGLDDEEAFCYWNDKLVNPNLFKRAGRIRFNEFYSNLVNFIVFREPLPSSDADTLNIRMFRGGDTLLLKTINMQYHLVIGRDTVFSFVGTNEAMAQFPIVDFQIDPDNYLFVYERIEGMSRSKGEWRRKLRSRNAVVNGEDLNKRRGYQNSLAPEFIDGRLFYLFQKGGEWGWYYDGIEHNEGWERVIYHYGDGTMGAEFERRPSYRRFSVLKDGLWYTVLGRLETVFD